jgi:hypothetical protein
MGSIRRTILFIVALLLATVGTASFAYLLLFAQGWKGWMVLGAGVMASLGLYLLWADFINADPRPES